MIAEEEEHQPSYKREEVNTALENEGCHGMEFIHFKKMMKKKLTV